MAHTFSRQQAATHQFTVRGRFGAVSVPDQRTPARVLSDFETRFTPKVAAIRRLRRNLHGRMYLPALA